MVDRADIRLCAQSALRQGLHHDTVLLDKLYSQMTRISSLREASHHVSRWWDGRLEGEVSDGSRAALDRLCNTSEAYPFYPATHM